MGGKSANGTSIKTNCSSDWGQVMRIRVCRVVAGALVPELPAALAPMYRIPVSMVSPRGIVYILVLFPGA